jgi:dephospho-CoA kinase
MIILGITGLAGSGKGSVAQYLANKGFVHYSVRDFLTEKLAGEGLKPDRDHMRYMADKLRHEFGPGFITAEIGKIALAANRDCVIESIRNPEEIRPLKGAGKFFLLSVTADPVARYERIRKRGSPADDVTFEKFMEQERLETAVRDKATGDILGCMKRADFTLDNNASLEKLYEQIDIILKSVI